MKYYQSIPNFLIWQSDSPAVFTELRPNLRPEKMPNSSARGSTQIFGPRKLSTFRPETMLARSVKQKLGPEMSGCFGRVLAVPSARDIVFSAGKKSGRTICSGRA